MLRATGENPVDPVSSGGERFNLKDANGAIGTWLLSSIDLQAILLSNYTKLISLFQHSSPGGVGWRGAVFWLKRRAEDILWGISRSGKDFSAPIVIGDGWLI